MAVVKIPQNWYYIPHGIAHHFPIDHEFPLSEIGHTRRCLLKDGMTGFVIKLTSSYVKKLCKNISCPDWKTNPIDHKLVYICHVPNDDEQGEADFVKQFPFFPYSAKELNIRNAEKLSLLEDQIDSLSKQLNHNIRSADIAKEIRTEIGPAEHELAEEINSAINVKFHKVIDVGKADWKNRFIIECVPLISKYSDEIYGKGVSNMVQKWINAILKGIDTDSAKIEWFREFKWLKLDYA